MYIEISDILTKNLTMFVYFKNFIYIYIYLKLLTHIEKSQL